MMVMDNITFAEAEAGHRELWNWLAETDGDSAYKRIWPGWDKYDSEAKNLCFPCEIAGTICSYCPIEWPNGQICAYFGSLYAVWRNEKDPAERKRLAEQIRDLPWREK
ncbi:MAG: hypothetical protein LBS24_00600 [Clostridiales Family XIII bacterium]|nr:hypothetical protein [Clostridiales Family XIII bacterium]